MTQRYHVGTVADNDDELKRGRLRVICGSVYSTEEPIPDWIAPRVTAASPDGVALFWIPPVGSVVYLEEDAGGQFRWLGSELGGLQELPAILAANYPARVGFTTPGGSHGLVMSDAEGLRIEVDGTRFLMDGKTVDAKQSDQAVAFKVILNTLDSPLSSGLSDVAAALGALGLPAPNLATVIAGLSAGTYDSTTLKSD